ncbi:MAG: ArnT family glycosyltransferase [Chloroflexota bacterium]
MQENRIRARVHNNYRYATWIVVASCLLLCLATLNYNGPFFDEGIYITAGIRTLEGAAETDRFLTWFGGSLLWPVLAGLGYRASGLIGTRAVAAVVTVGGLGAFAQAVRNIFGAKTGFWATLGLALNGPFLALARLGVYDTLALSLTAVALWAITELKQRDHRGWLGVSAAAFSVAVFAKYPIAIMALPLLGTLLLLRNDRASTDIFLFVFLAGALGLVVFLPLRDQVAQFFSWRLDNRPTFGVPLRGIILTIVYSSIIPLILALAGWFIVRRKRGLASLMLLSLAIWPTYHLITEDPVSTSKHLVFGYLFAYPLVGVTLGTIWGNARSHLLRRTLAVFVVAVLAGVGLLQVNQSDHSWPDARPGAGFLVARVQRGDKLAINDSWPYIMYLYTAGRIDSPGEVYDEYRITHEEWTPPICEYDWFVDTRGTLAWPEEFLEQKTQCSTFEEVFSTTSQVIQLGAAGNYVSNPVETIVWKNTAE